MALSNRLLDSTILGLCTGGFLNLQPLNSTLTLLCTCEQAPLKPIRDPYDSLLPSLPLLSLAGKLLAGRVLHEMYPSQVHGLARFARIVVYTSQFLSR